LVNTKLQIKCLKIIDLPSDIVWIVEILLTDWLVMCQLMAQTPWSWGGSVVECFSTLVVCTCRGSNPGVDTGEKGKKEQITFNLFSNCIVYP
jgi:hypothetical protein